VPLEGIHRWVCCRSGFVFGINQSNSFFPPVLYLGLLCVLVSLAFVL
jgi:hypothetical protein